jgi:hypothetical protein
MLNGAANYIGKNSLHRRLPNPRTDGESCFMFMPLATTGRNYRPATYRKHVQIGDFLGPLGPHFRGDADHLRIGGLPRAESLTVSSADRLSQACADGHVVRTFFVKFRTP